MTAKVLLIGANQYKRPWPVMPVGMCMIAASLEEEGYAVKVVDLCFSEDYKADVAKAVAEFKPDLIGVSIRNIDNCAGYETEFLLDDQREMMAEIKRLFSGPIIMGGPAIAINGNEMLELFDMDYAVCGDGEPVMNEIARRIAASEPLEGIRGLTIRKNGTIVQQGEYCFDTDPNTLPMYKPHRYLDMAGYIDFDTSLQIQTKRGCALKCSYCPNRLIEGGRYRLRNPQIIADHIEMLVKESGIHSIEFVDSTFNVPLPHAKSVLRAIIAKKMNLELKALGINPISIDEELIGLMKEAGFKEASLGIDAACDATLDDYQKGFKQRDIARAAEIMRMRKMPVAWYLLLGAEAESYETLMDSLRFVGRVARPLDGVFIAVGVRVYRGSPIADRMVRENPACSKDNFFRPLAVHPRLNLDAVMAVTRDFALRQANFIVYNDDKTPLDMVRIGFHYGRKYMPNMPIWRMHIFGRMVQKYTGFLGLRRLKFRLLNRKILKEAAIGRPTKKEGVKVMLSRNTTVIEEATTTAGNGRYAAELRNVSKEYKMGGNTVRAVSDVSLTIAAGEFTAIIGPSGSGKSTLLDILGGIARPNSGSVFIDGQDISNLSDGELSAIRVRRVGFVFQNFSLIDVLNAYENIEYPLMLLKRSESERRKRVLAMLERVDLEKFARHRPSELSGGQCQRVAIARALAAEPAFVLADEPTANLDSEMGASIMDLMIDVNRTVGTTFIFASHDPALVERTRKVIRIKDGKIVQP